MLTLDSVYAGYGQTEVLRNVAIEVADGEVIALLGPNGAGKSTLLRTASGLLKPNSGRIVLEGTEVTGRRPDQFAQRGVCHLPEGRGIFPSLTVRENLVVLIRNLPPRAAVESAVALFPFLSKRLSVQAGALSGGEQQMLTLTRAYLTQPRIVLIDEASLGLAPLIVDQVYDALRALADRGIALIIVEQYVQRALELASRVYILVGGEIIFQGEAGKLDPAEIYDKYLGIES
jgi:branched-chain amino acid transport system ATP-binding protein